MVQRTKRSHRFNDDMLKLLTRIFSTKRGMFLVEQKVKQIGGLYFVEENHFLFSIIITLYFKFYPILSVYSY